MERERPARRVGLVGAGGIAEVHAQAWRSLGADLLVYSTGGSEELVARHGGRTCASLAELLERCDLVDVCTPTPVHPAVVLAAAEAGRPVICEKPLALEVAQARSMLQACARAGVPLFPAHVVRWFEPYATMRAAVLDGLVGQVAVQRFDRTGSRPTQAWFSDDESSGGNVTDQSIHDLDQARWSAGEIEEVYAQQTERGGDGDQRRAVRSVQVTCRHRSGAISQVSGTWARPGTRFTTSFEVAGTAGLLRHDSRDHPDLGLDQGERRREGAVDDEGRGLLPALGVGESPYRAQLRELAQAIDGGPTPRVDAADGLWAVALAAAARASLRTGAPVPVVDPLADPVEDAAEDAERSRG